MKVSPGAYANNKTVEESEDVPVIFQQNTGFSRSNYQENIDADAILYADPTNDFIISHYNRLEGMYVIISPFGAPEDISWYKVTNVTIFRDHLIGNQIDNIQCALKKTRPVQTIS